MKSFRPEENYRITRKTVGYVPRAQATQADYERIGFRSGLEVHQQLKTERKLFCRCPAARYQADNDYDAEIVRHMRPTLSELGEYDGTALMEFKTRKEILYRLKNQSACTYDVDDTPPFPLNREALEIALEISLLSKFNIVGEVHITRKQYLDGSIPAGFQRTAILGVEGEIRLRNKTVRLIQLSIEEDSCREVSDIGHRRVYRTDRLGIPLIETVTYPEMVHPEEVREVCNAIRFLNRSTGKVRTGMGAARQDVNVSCRGGTRVEIKGVAHTRWIPALTHNEAFRQWSLLRIRETLRERVADPAAWKMSGMDVEPHRFALSRGPLREALAGDLRLMAVNLPGFHGLLSHFTQPGKVFADEISDRIKVIACIEKPNMTHSEELNPTLSEADLDRLGELLNAGPMDAQILVWGPAADIQTALETVEERCRMAFQGVPGETRKSFADGTTVFERVLPGADRMYPDTDSAPIPLADEDLERLSRNLPEELVLRSRQLADWGVPDDAQTYIFSRNLYPLIQRIVRELELPPKWIGVFIGQRFKSVEGKDGRNPEFSYELLFELFRFIRDKGLELEIAGVLLPILYRNPRMDLESILASSPFKPMTCEEIIDRIPFLRAKFRKRRPEDAEEKAEHWILGQLRSLALGNMRLTDLAGKVRETREAARS
ncbi:MAG: Glu-tRNA(Gln) amidotransferase subunit GatE [Kiritimatiellia bacterium]|nr:Glu-tRNA(Gln) amidotransferase subunit GatE [Kiritimatiellia bacterium]